MIEGFLEHAFTVLPQWAVIIWQPLNPLQVEIIRLNSFKKYFMTYKKTDQLKTVIFNKLPKLAENYKEEHYSINFKVT